MILRIYFFVQISYEFTILKNQPFMFNRLFLIFLKYFCKKSFHIVPGSSICSRIVFNRHVKFLTIFSSGRIGKCMRSIWIRFKSIINTCRVHRFFKCSNLRIYKLVRFTMTYQDFCFQQIFIYRYA